MQLLSSCSMLQAGDPRSSGPAFRLLCAWLLTFCCSSARCASNPSVRWQCALARSSRQCAFGTIPSASYHQRHCSLQPTSAPLTRWSRLIETSCKEDLIVLLPSAMRVAWASMRAANDVTRLQSERDQLPPAGWLAIRQATLVVHASSVDRSARRKQHYK